MTTRAQLDAAEAWLLEEFRDWRDLRFIACTRKERDRVATAIRAIRAQRKALDAERDGWQLVHVDELTVLRASMEFACVTPNDNCDCSGCMAAAAFAGDVRVRVSDQT